MDTNDTNYIATCSCREKRALKDKHTDAGWMRKSVILTETKRECLTENQRERDGVM